MDGDKQPRQPGTLVPNNVPANPEALAQAQPFIRHLASDDRRVVDLAETIYSERTAGKGVPRLLRMRAQIVCVLLKLYSAYLNDPARYVRYSRDPRRYKKNRYNRLPITWRKLSRVVSSLASELIEHHNGIPGFDDYENGKQAQ